MAKCKFCDKQDIPKDQLFSHYWQEHREQMLEQRRRQGAPVKHSKNQDKSKSQGKDYKVGIVTVNPLEASTVKFVGQTLVVPKTPALIYGYFCAKKMGFEGSVAEFIQDVIDDFYEARGIDYYKEVMGLPGSYS